MRKVSLIGIGLNTMLVALFMGGCGKSAPQKSADTLGGLGLTKAEGSSLACNGESCFGSGSIVFTSPLESSFSGKNYSFLAYLENGGGLTVVSHANKDLSNAVKISFLRLDSFVTVSVNGGPASTLFGVDGARELPVSIDVHNDESPAHILVWVGNQAVYEEDNAVFNSEDSESFTGNGQGSFWGFTLNNATVRSVEAADPKAEHDE